MVGKNAQKEGAGNNNKRDKRKLLLKLTAAQHEEKKKESGGHNKKGTTTKKIAEHCLGEGVAHDAGNKMWCQRLDGGKGLSKRREREAHQREPFPAHRRQRQSHKRATNLRKKKTRRKGLDQEGNRSKEREGFFEWRWKYGHFESEGI